MGKSLDSKQIAKNSIALYLRTFITLIVGLYTSKVTLATLGVEDYGIYNIVGGIVILFTCINSSLRGSTQRFLNFHIGRGEYEQLSRIFSISLYIHIATAVILFLLGELIGGWFLNDYLNIPAHRMYAANWVFHFSLACMCITLVRVPYESCIVAYEKMDFYAYVGILEAVLKLIIIYILLIGDYDKLILYAILIFVVTLLVNLCFVVYCRIKFPISKIIYVCDVHIIKRLLSFIGWNFFSSITSLFAMQGVNIMFNLFHGVVLNAAVGLANNVNRYISTFSSGFQVAYSPQVVKLYAQEEYENLRKLIMNASKFGYLLFFIPSVIFILNADFIFEIWLGKIPDYTIEFTTVILLCTLVDSLTGPYYHAIQAGGKIRNYQICISISFVLDIILTFIMLYLKLDVRIVYLSRFITRGLLNMCIGLLFLRTRIKFSVRYYAKTILAPLILYSFIVIFTPIVVTYTFNGWIKFLISVIIYFPLSLSLAYYMLLNANEKEMIVNRIKKNDRR